MDKNELIRLLEMFSRGNLSLEDKPVIAVPSSTGYGANSGGVSALLSMLIAFGVLYSAYGLYKFLNRGAHLHLPSFLLPRSIRKRNIHPGKRNLQDQEDAANLTPWILFLIFVFGPCEVLIPMLLLVLLGSLHGSTG